MNRPKMSDEYKDLILLEEPMDLVYGPLQSRRFGLSLGINPLGHLKVCSYDCPYCELGPTEIRMNQIKREVIFPEVFQIEECLRMALRKINDSNTRLESLTISGNGEPTLYPHFSELVEMINQVKPELCPDVPTRLLTNGAHIDSNKIVHAMNQLNERIVKVDAGNEAVFRSVNAPLIRANLSKVTSGARKLEDCIVQSLFITGNVSNIGNADIDEWMEVVGLIQPKKVQICTLARVPWTPGLQPVEEDQLHIIASKLKRRLHVDSEVFF